MKRYSLEWEEQENRRMDRLEEALRKKIEEEILPNSYRKQLKEGKKNGK